MALPAAPLDSAVAWQGSSVSGGGGMACVRESYIERMQNNACDGALHTRTTQCGVTRGRDEGACAIHQPLLRHPWH